MSGVYCTDGNLCLAGCSSDKRKCENVKPLSLWEIVELQTELAQAKEQLAAREAWIKAIMIPFREHEAKVLEEAAAVLDEYLPNKFESPTTVLTHVADGLRRMAQEWRGKSDL